MTDTKSMISLSATTTNDTGYHEKLCLSCIITEGLGPHKFIKNDIEIIGHPKPEVVNLVKKSEKPSPFEAY